MPAIGTNSGLSPLTLALALLLLASVTCDVAGQVFFKVGVDQLPDLTDQPGLVSAKITLSNPWIGAGLVAYVVELIVWLVIMSAAPLSVAFPIASANFLLITIASWWLLGEKVTQHQWIGAGLITFGVAVVAQSA